MAASSKPQILSSAVHRWDVFPHPELRLQIYSKLKHNAVERSAQDVRWNDLKSKLALHRVVEIAQLFEPACPLTTNTPEEQQSAKEIREAHHQFIELAACRLTEHLRCTRDVYCEHVDELDCGPVLEARWVVLRFAVFPTALQLLRQRVIEYANLTGIAGRDLSLLFGVPTRTCYKEPDPRGFGFLRPPDLNDDTAASDEELESLGDLINEDTLLWFRDIRNGGGVGYRLSGGPFAIDDENAIRDSWLLCGSKVGIVLTHWLRIRGKLWLKFAPWTEGLCKLFGAVQEELLSQFAALPLDSSVRELEVSRQSSNLPAIVVPLEAKVETPTVAERVARAVQNHAGNPTMSVEEVAHALHRSPPTVYRYIDEGKLKWSGSKGRIATTSVKALLEISPE